MSDALAEAVAAAQSAAAAVNLCVPLLRKEGSALAAGTALMERIRMGLEDEAGIASIMHAIRCHMAPHISITEQVLQLLPLVESPAALIDAIPQVQQSLTPMLIQADASCYSCILQLPKDTGAEH
jgi:hypothetical protein